MGQRAVSRGAAGRLGGWLLAALAFFGVYAALTQHPPQSARLLRLADRSRLPLAQALPDLLDARVVFVGELHDRPAHHRAQLRLIRALHEAGRPLAVGLEMFRASAQGELDRWVAGELSSATFRKVYRDNWNYPWEGYGAIWAYAREHGIPLLGLNVSRALVRRVAREGFASLPPDQVAGLPPIRCEVDETYERFIRRALGAHGRSGPAFLHFCEAQLVWDVGMAYHLGRYLNAHPDTTVVVLAGSGHAWKRGIPAQLARQGPVAVRVLVPEIPGRLEPSTATVDDADYLWLDLAPR
ncbi:MAG: ChaN family lipoprotein [Deferrisomatales bacterium]